MNFRKAQNRIQDSAKLKRLIVDLIDKEMRSAAGVDIKGDAYEELLSKGARTSSPERGQYFTVGSWGPDQFGWLGGRIDLSKAEVAAVGVVNAIRRVRRERVNDSYESSPEYGGRVARDLGE